MEAIYANGCDTDDTASAAYCQFIVFGILLANFLTIRKARAVG